MTYPEQKELTPLQKIVGVLFLLGFVAVLFLGTYAALTSGQPLIPYNPEVMQWELPWWMVN